MVRLGGDPNEEEKREEGKSWIEFIPSKTGIARWTVDNMAYAAAYWEYYALHGTSLGEYLYIV